MWKRRDGGVRVSNANAQDARGAILSPTRRGDERDVSRGGSGRGGANAGGVVPQEFRVQRRARGAGGGAAVGIEVLHRQEAARLQGFPESFALDPDRGHHELETSWRCRSCETSRWETLRALGVEETSREEPSEREEGAGQTFEDATRKRCQQSPVSSSQHPRVYTDNVPTVELRKTEESPSAGQSTTNEGCRRFDTLRFAFL